MVLKHETVWYTILSIICLIFIIILTIFSPRRSFKQDRAFFPGKITHTVKPSNRLFRQSPSKEISSDSENNSDKALKGKLSSKAGLGVKASSEEYSLTFKNIVIFWFLSLLNTALFIFGIINLFIFIARSANKKPFSVINALPRSLSLSSKSVSMLIFGITYLYLAMYLVFFALVPKNQPGPGYSLTVFIILSVIFYTFIIIGVLKVIPFKDLGIGLSFEHIVYSVRMYFATAVVILLTALILFQIQKIFHIHFNAQPMVYVIAALREKWFLTILILEIAILAPISEEMLFRGIIYNYLKKRIRWGYAAFLTSLLFAFLHANLFGFFVIFIISMAICYVYEKSNNIIAAFFFHSLHNTFSIANILILKHLFVS